MYKQTIQTRYYTTIEQQSDFPNGGYNYIKDLEYIIIQTKMFIFIQENNDSDFPRCNFI